MKEKTIILIKKLFSTRRRAIFTLVVLIIGGYYFWGKFKNVKEETITQTATVERGTIVSSITASGSIISSNIENITTQTSGTVSKVYVSDGDEVFAGQKLAEIDLDVQGEQNYASSYSSYISASISLNSAKNSLELANASLDVVYDEIKGHDEDENFETKETRIRAEVSQRNAVDGVTSAQARFYTSSLSLKTNSPTITAPVAGTIKSVTIAEGMNIGAAETASGARANQRVATIATGGLPIATFNISEIDVSQIVPGQKATITLDSITDKTFTGKVVSVDRVGMISSNVTTYTTIIQFDTSSDQILPNMAVVANIIIDSKSDVLTIPSQAVKYQDGQASVTIIRNGQEQSVAVEVGIFNDTQTEIVSGLKEGDIVITGTATSKSQDIQERGGSMFGGGGVGRMIH